MPKKIRHLESMLKKAGFENLGGKGSHRNYYHDNGYKITISGKAGDDAKKYQEKQVDEVIAKSKE